jgi:hypothetical protein
MPPKCWASDSNYPTYVASLYGMGANCNWSMAWEQFCRFVVFARCRVSIFIAAQVSTMHHAWRNYLYSFTPLRFRAIHLCLTLNAFWFPEYCTLSSVTRHRKKTPFKDHQNPKENLSATSVTQIFGIREPKVVMVQSLSIYGRNPKKGVVGSAFLLEIEESQLTDSLLLYIIRSMLTFRVVSTIELANVS